MTNIEPEDKRNDVMVGMLKQLPEKAIDIIRYTTFTRLPGEDNTVRAHDSDQTVVRFALKALEIPYTYVPPNPQSQRKSFPGARPERNGYIDVRGEDNLIALAHARANFTGSVKLTVKPLPEETKEQRLRKDMIRAGLEPIELQEEREACRRNWAKSSKPAAFPGSPEYARSIRPKSEEKAASPKTIRGRADASEEAGRTH